MEKKPTKNRVREERRIEEGQEERRIEEGQEEKKAEHRRTIKRRKE